MSGPDGALRFLRRLVRTLPRDVGEHRPTRKRRLRGRANQRRSAAGVGPAIRRNVDPLLRRHPARQGDRPDRRADEHRTSQAETPSFNRAPKGKRFLLFRSRTLQNGGRIRRGADEKPVGHRAAVVRIYCQDDMRTRSIGSGTLVRWIATDTAFSRAPKGSAARLVVLTARHVVADAKNIVVELFNKKTHQARVLKVDAVWDCAVLELDGKPEGVTAAEVELGEAAMQHEGSRLESCGYGPDGKLAVNTGLFLGYKRSTQTPNGPDDWFEISGHARPGDSGGGVFNERGRLVGVLWGTNGEVVVGVQAGRLHLLLDSAVPKTIEQKALVLTGTVPIFVSAKMGLSPWASSQSLHESHAAEVRRADREFAAGVRRP